MRSSSIPSSPLERVHRWRTRAHPGAEPVEEPPRCALGATNALFRGASAGSDDPSRWEGRLTVNTPRRVPTLNVPEMPSTVCELGELDPFPLLSPRRGTKDAGWTPS